VIEERILLYDDFIILMHEENTIANAVEEWQIIMVFFFGMACVSIVHSKKLGK
jgi:hypothetical protein